MIDRLRELAELFAEKHKQLYLVGGSVRDELLGQGNSDLDLATDALPQETKALAAQLRPDGIYTVGEKFGTVGLVFGEQRMEVTTFRSERYDYQSRKPEVGFGTSLEEDLARRDFTINALAREPLGGQIIDRFGGLHDLRAGLIRAVGDPQERFVEDPLRLLRAVRFACQLGFSIELLTRRAMAASAEKLRLVSRERIGEETNKILLSPRPAQGVRVLCELGLMAYIAPEVLTLQGLRDKEKRHKDVFEHTLAVLSRVPPQLPLRWAALLHDIAKPDTIAIDKGKVHFYGHDALGAAKSRAILSDLRLDRRTIEVVARLIRMHLRINQYESDWTDGAIRRLAREAGEQLEDLFILSRADITSYRAQKVAKALAKIDELERRYQELKAQEDLAQFQSPLDGNELMALFGRPPGPWIRPVKEYLLSLVLDGQLAQEDKERARELALEFVAKRKSE